MLAAEPDTIAGYYYTGVDSNSYGRGALTSSATLVRHDSYAKNFDRPLDRPLPPIPRVRSRSPVLADEYKSTALDVRSNFGIFLPIVSEITVHPWPIISLRHLHLKAIDWFIKTVY